MELKTLALLVADLWCSEKPDFWEKSAVVTAMLEAGDDEDFIAACELLYNGPYTSAKNLRLKLADEANVYSHTPLNNLKGETFPQALASESRDYESEGLTVKQALAILKEIDRYDILGLTRQMGELEALLFWGAALSRAPSNFTRGAFIYALACVRTPEWEFTPDDTLLAYSTTPFLEVVNRLLHSPETIPSLKPRAESPVRGANYQPWGKSSTPEGYFLDIVRGPRRFLHIHDGKAALRNRNGERCVSLHSMWSGHRPRGDWIVEVESIDNRLWSVTDCLFRNGSTIHLPYEERLVELEPWSHHDKRLKIAKPLLLTGHEAAVDVMEMLGDGDMARIVDPGPYKPGGKGGWILIHHAFQFRLLVTHAKKDQDGFVCLRLAALDGFDTYHIHTLTLDAEQSANIIFTFNRRGFTAEEDWEDTEGLGVVMEGSCTDIDRSTYEFLNYEPTGVNGELGRGDTTQFTDIVEVAK